MTKKYSTGIKVFGACIILSSLIQMAALGGIEKYREIFRHLPEEILYLRFLFSWALRIIGLMSGIGILFRKNIFRKILLGIFWFTIFTVYFKHPETVFRTTTYQIWQDMGRINTVIMAPSTAARIAWITTIVLEVFFAAGFIFYFTRPHIKKQFNQPQVLKKK